MVLCGADMCLPMLIAGRTLRVQLTCRWAAERICAQLSTRLKESTLQVVLPSCLVQALIHYHALQLSKKLPGWVVNLNRRSAEVRLVRQ